MKIAFLAAGAANMICGSCLRDNAVASAMMRLGHDVLMVPLYTPVRVDRDGVSIDQVFYGGINAFLQTKSSFFRRVRIFDRMLNSRVAHRMAAKFSSMNKAEELGEFTLASLEGDRGSTRREVLRLADWLATDIKPDIINLPNSMFVGFARILRQRVGVPVICSLTGEDVFVDGLPRSYRMRALELMRSGSSEIDGFISISHYYRRHMSSVLDVPQEKIDVVPIGLNVEGYGRAQDRPVEPFMIGYLARIDRVKGLELLCRAWRELRSMPGTENARLLVGGYLHEPDHLKEIQELVTEWKLNEDFEYVGELTFDQKIAFLDRLSVLSVPTIYAEPKGLFVLEALAHKVPVVQPDCGAFPELLEATGGGLLFKAGDAHDLAEKLYAIFKDRAEADRLASLGSAAVRAQFTDEVMATNTIGVYQKYL